MAKATAEAKVSINERPPPRAYPSANVLYMLPHQVSHASEPG
jgi:hypothetical protein